MTEEEGYFYFFFIFTTYFDDIFTKTALFTVIITTVVSFYLIYGRPNRPFLCATSLASATLSYYYLRNSHVYLHYSLSSHDSQAVTLPSLLLIHAVLSLSSPAPVAVKGVRRAFYRFLCSAMQATGFLFYLGSRGFSDDVAAAVALYTFSLFIVCFMKALAPEMKPYDVLSIMAYSMLSRVSNIFFLCLIFVPIFCYFIAFHLAGFLQAWR